MKNRLPELILTFSLLGFSLTSVSAQDWQGICWTNGNQMLVGEQLTPSQVLLVGNGFFDAGYGYLFDLEKTGEESWNLTSAPKPLAMPKEKDGVAYQILVNDSYNGSMNLHWKRKEVKGIDVLLEYDRDGKVTSAYAETGLDLTEHSKYKIMELFAGVYTDGQGRQWSFGVFEHECSWAGRITHFEMDDQLGAPDFAIKVDGKLYSLQLTMEGMNIYEAQPDENGSFYKRTRKVVSLTADKSMPRFSDASVHPCDTYAVSLLDASVVRLMRNEIYARHGWVFQNATLDRYFRSCEWYEPLGDNSQIRLNEMELLNVSLLKYQEQMRK